MSEAFWFRNTYSMPFLQAHQLKRRYRMIRADTEHHRQCQRFSRHLFYGCSKQGFRQRGCQAAGACPQQTLPAPQTLVY